MSRLYRNEHGDTLVEVLLATVVISIVIAGAFAISRRAAQINQAAYEKTEVSHQLTEYAELIRESRNVARNSPGWQKLLSYSDATPVAVTDCSSSGARSAFIINDAFNGGTPINPSEASFFIDYDRSTTPQADTYPNDLFEVWGEVLETTAVGSNYVDIYLRACWEGIGSETEQRSAIVLRLER